MPDAVIMHRSEIERVCREHGVRMLYLFGSGAQDRYDPASSDLDFQVDLGEYEVGVSARFMALHASLSRLFGRQVDLITVRSSGNEPFLREVKATRVTIFSA